MHRSVFSYNLSRTYPFKWFSWAVLIGGISAIDLFSVINLTADGYNARYFSPAAVFVHMITLASNAFATDPNTTIASRNWFQKLPWALTSKVFPAYPTLLRSTLCL